MAHTSTALPLLETEEHQTLILASKERSCREKLSTQTEVPGYCPGTWDEILCWDQTPAGQLSVQTCPAYIAGFHQTANATRQCLPSGTWFVHEQIMREWTNYSQCTNGPDATVLIHFAGNGNVTVFGDYVPAIKTISRIGYGVSLVSLAIAFCILATIKKLRCPRNMLHMHLFISFIMRAFMAILKDSLFVMGVGLLSDISVKTDGSYFNSEEEENWKCKLFTTMWQYFIMANYSWILMEGLYLHNLIFLALFTDSSAITLYVALGWGLPTLFVVPWAICRVLLENTLCWTTNINSNLFLLIRVPTTVSIVLNFLLFLNIIRVLLSKMRSSVCDESKTYRRWAKSTLVLVPLFGVHYMVFLVPSYYVGVDEIVEVTWLFCDQFFASFQGFFVAVLYCFLNGEVRTELSKKKKRLSCSKLMSLLPWSRRESMSNGILSTGRFHFKARHNQPRASCYSSTSFTSVSVVPNSNCCLNKKRGAIEFLRGSNRTGMHSSFHGGVPSIKHTPDLPPIKSFSEDNDLSSRCGQERRWSKADYNAENEIELRSIADTTQ